MRGSKFNKTRLEKGLSYLGLAGFLLPVFSVQAAVTTIDSMTVISDGAAPFTTGTTNGNDTSANNGVIRSNDEVVYDISYSTNNTDEVSFTAVLPATMVWDSSAMASTVCNGSAGGTLSADRATLTCSRIPIGASESFQLKAWVISAANGDSVSASISSGSASNNSASLTVSATPKTGLRLYADSFSRTQRGGVWGYQYRHAISVGAKLPAAPNDNFKGFEAVRDIAFDLEVQPGAIVISSGSHISYTQASPGDPIAVQIANPSHYHNLFNAEQIAGHDSPWRGIPVSSSSVRSITIWVPEEYPSGSGSYNFPPLATSYLTTQMTDYSITGMSGVVSDYDEPAYTDPTYSCPASGTMIISQVACVRYLVDRTDPVRVSPAYGSTVYSSGIYLYGDNHGYAQGYEKVVPGQTFHAMLGMYNSAVAEAADPEVRNCVTWDPELLELVDVANLKYATATNFYHRNHLAWPNLPATPGRVVLEYSAQPYADDNARRNVDCGVAGDGDTDWTNDYASLDSTQISSVRYLYRGVSNEGLEPERTVGLDLPMKRTTTVTSLALATEDPLPVFRQYYAEGVTVNSGFNPAIHTSARTGTYVQATANLSRHSLTTPASSAPGSSFAVSVTPIVIGAAEAGVNSTAENVQITLDFPNTYLQPIESSIAAALPPGATYVLTPADLGADNIAGTADDGNPAQVIISLGDLAAPGGAVGPSPYQGHATTYSEISFMVQADYKTTVGNYEVVSTITSDTDPTITTTNTSPNSYSPAGDNQQTSVVAITGVAALEVNKSLLSGGTTDATTSTTYITAGEPFTYQITFGNGSADTKGVITLVDVLPFDGDSRGTTGLGDLEIVSVTAEMANLSQGTVAIQYTTDASSAVEAAVQTAGNEDGATGISWTTYSSGSFPSDVTALRFISSELLSGFSGSADITLRSMTALTNATELFNDIYGETGTPDFLTFDGIGLVSLYGQPAGTLNGTIFDDTSADSIQDPGEAGIAGITVTVTCTQGPNCTVGDAHTAETDTNGDYSFAPGATVDGQPNFIGLMSGQWEISIPSATGWLEVSSVVGTITDSFSNTVSTGLGSAAVRSIAGVTLSKGGSAVDYNFARSSTKLTVTKSVDLSATTAVSSADIDAAAYDFTFEASCTDNASVTTTHSAVLTAYSSTNTEVDIIGVPTDSTCTVSETALPAAPTDHIWDTPVVAPATVSVLSTGLSTATVTNKLIRTGYINFNPSVSLPAGVTNTFDFTFIATCDLPTAGTTHQATFSYPGQVGSLVTVSGVHIDSSCTIDAALPGAPAGFAWDAPVIGTPVVLLSNSVVTVDVNIDLVLRSMASPSSSSASPIPSTGRFALVILTVGIILLAAVFVRLNPRVTGMPG